MARRLHLSSAVDTARLIRRDDVTWELPPERAMRVPVILYGSESLIRGLDDKVIEQASNVAGLPGIVGASYVMPDGHWGYGFPVGGVAAFDAEAGGVISAGGVGFDISCGVRCLVTRLSAADVVARRDALADTLAAAIPAGVGSTGTLHLSERETDAMLIGGARWAVERGHGTAADLDRTEERGQMRHAKPRAVSARARQRQKHEMGTLGSGNHYLEVQRVAEIFADDAARAYGLAVDDVVVMIHCGSRGLGHQIGTDFLAEMAAAAPGLGIRLPDRELACAPIDSELGQRYLGAMRAAINCALANRQILTHLVRGVFAEVLPAARLSVLYDVSHNTCKVEEHLVDGRPRPLHVHRKGATRALGPGHPDLPAPLSAVGQPVLIGGSMGTSSFVLAGIAAGEARSWSSACHGAGRAMSRHQATRTWGGREVLRELAGRGIAVRSPSLRGIAEEAPGAYKDVVAVVDAAAAADLARKVARLDPMIVVKG